MYRDKFVYKQDFLQVEAKHQTRVQHKEGLIKYYEPGTTYYNQSPVVVGAVAATELTDYVVASFLPNSGAWIDSRLENDDSDSVKNAIMAQDIMSEKLSESNFYSEVQKCIFKTLVYGHSLVSIDYSGGGFSFMCIDDQEIMVSEDTNLTNTRIYVRKQMTGLDIKTIYENVPSFMYTSSDMDQRELDAAMYYVVTGYIPNIDKYFTSGTGKGYKTVHFMVDDRAPDVLEPKVKEEKFNVLPIAKFSSEFKGGSLGEMALPALTELQDLAIRFSEYASYVTHPAKEVDMEAITSGQFNLSTGGIIPLSSNARPTRPVEVAGQLPFGQEDFQRLESIVRRIFKTDLIDQSRIQELSSMHVAGYKLSAIDAIMPLLDDVFNKTLKAILERCHSVLMKEDKDYRIASNYSKAKQVPKGLIGYKRNLENVVATGRYLQTAAPLIQADPQSAIVLNVEGRLKGLARELGLADILKSTEEVQSERQAIAQRQQQAAAAQQQQMEAQTGKLQAEAAEKGGEPDVQEERF